MIVAASPTDATKNVVKVSGQVNGYDKVIGAPIKNADGAPVVTLAVGDVIRYNVKLYSTVGFSIPAPGDAPVFFSEEVTGQMEQQVLQQVLSGTLHRHRQFLQMNG